MKTKQAMEYLRRNADVPADEQKVIRYLMEHGKLRRPIDIEQRDRVNKAIETLKKKGVIEKKEEFYYFTDIIEKALQKVNLNAYDKKLIKNVGKIKKPTILDLCSNALSVAEKNKK